jgi:hypothetical protein
VLAGGGGAVLAGGGARVGGAGGRQRSWCGCWRATARRGDAGGASGAMRAVQRGAAVGQPDGIGLSSSRAKTAMSRSLEPTGEEEGLYTPTPFSPDPWLKPGLKGGH